MSEQLHVHVDEQGRIVLPESVRQKLGIEAGADLVIEIDPDSVQPASETPDDALVEKNGILVHTGRAVHPLDPVESVRRARQAQTERIRSRDEEE